MTKTQILELEKNYNKFRFKRLVKRVFIGIFCVSFFALCFVFFFFLKFMGVSKDKK